MYCYSLLKLFTGMLINIPAECNKSDSACMFGFPKVFSESKQYDKSDNTQWFSQPFLHGV